MPKPGSDVDAAAFAERLAELLVRHGRQRHGAGAYLAKKYKVSTVTANAWLNGEHKPDIPTARQIALDHGTTFDALYFGGPESRNPDSSMSSQSARPDMEILAEAITIAMESEDGLTAESLMAAYDLRAEERSAAKPLGKRGRPKEGVDGHGADERRNQGTGENPRREDGQRKK